MLFWGEELEALQNQKYSKIHSRGGEGVKREEGLEIPKR